MIIMQDVFLRYPHAKTDTIQGVSFHVQPGEIFGFLGPSGAGKSTLQKILTGTLPSYRGNVQVLGVEAKNRTADYYQNIGVDFEFPNFFSKFTALENLQYFASLYAAKPISPMLLLESVGLQEHANKKVGSFSKGMKMRLSFIRCLLHQPALLFLDEPTSGLDPANARLLKNMILEQKNLGKTVILTTHNMHDAAEICDRVAFIVDGKIKALGTPHSLQQNSSNTQVEFSYRENNIEKSCTTSIQQLNATPAFQKALQASALTSIHSKEQTLEDVFIQLTGRGLQ